MSLQPCRECGHHVSTKAKSCPRCGLPKPTRARVLGLGGVAKALLALCLVGGAIGIGVAARLYQESRPVEPIRPSVVPTRFPRLSVQLALSGGRILVTNLDDHPWTSCRVDVNAGVPDGAFSREIGEVGVGEQVALRLDAFARADGRSFDESADRVQVVDVHCDTPAGRAHFSGGL
jgi:hypothetical protein